MSTAKSRSMWGSVGGLMENVLFGEGRGNPRGECGLVAGFGGRCWHRDVVSSSDFNWCLLWPCSSGAAQMLIVKSIFSQCL